MSKSKDPPAPAHHLRIELSNLDEVTASLVSYQYARAVVKHIAGRTGEHPHLHVFLQWEKPITKVGAKDRLRKLPGFASLHGNGDWSFRPHDSYANWCKYVAANISALSIKSDEDLDQAFEETPKVPIVSSPLNAPGAPAAITRVQTVKSRLTAEQRLIRYIEIEKGWLVGQKFTIHHDVAKMTTEARKAVIEYSNGRVHNTQLIAMTRNVLFVFGTDEFQEYLKDQIGARLEII